MMCNRYQRHGIALLATAWLCTWAGCWSVQARVSGVSSVYALGASPASEPDHWPKRMAVQSGLKPETIDSYRIKKPNWQPTGMIVPLEPPLVPARSTGRGAKQAAIEQEEDAKRMRAALIDPPSSAAAATIQGEAPGSFYFSAPPREEKREPLAQSPARATKMFKFVSLREPRPIEHEPTSLPANNDSRVQPLHSMQLERTWFSYYDPFPPQNAEGLLVGDKPIQPRGLALVIPGMFGTPQEQVVSTVRRLRTDGWAVLRMLSHPSRFTEKATYRIPVQGDLTNAARAVGAELTDRAAECAYASEAAMLYVSEFRPELMGKPRIALGMSGGAMVLPTVIARDPDAYDAAVFIAGGADYLKILTTSNYTDMIDAIHVQWIDDVGRPAKPTSERLAELYKTYRESAPLDSTATAPKLVGKPILMLHATGDKAVPADTGDELWTLLGKPERWTIDGGHEWLFLTLGSKIGPLSDWLNTHVPSRVPSETSK